MAEERAGKPEPPSRRSGAASRAFELVPAVLGFALVGYWLGGKYGDARIGAGIGALLGVVGGMYNLVRQSLADSRRASANRQKSEK